MRIAVIGGGAIGAACALFVKRSGGPAVDVTVVEPDPTLRLASSARSAASIRQQFSQPVNVALSRFGFEVIDNPGDWLAVDGAVPHLGLVRSGYLFLATSAAGAAVLQANRAVQQAEGAAVRALSPDELAGAMPWLRTDDLCAATLGERGEGWFDGEAFTRALGAQARHLGARWLPGRVVAAERDGPRLCALRLADGQRLGADAVVLVAGAWSGAVGRALGLAVPVEARKRTVFMLTCPTPLGAGGAPLTTPLVVDPSGVWFRSEGDGFIAGWSPSGADADPPDLPLDQPDLQQFDDRVWPALAHRVPAFEALRVRSAWDGYYEVHPADHNGLVGPHPDCPNLLLACGFSGHGLQHAPGVGRGIAEWLQHDRFTSIDLSPLSAQRLASGQAVVEQAII
jgi:glycine/D-amino acid oxidase-like deaminating enzyme